MAQEQTNDVDIWTGKREGTHNYATTRTTAIRSNSGMGLVVPEIPPKKKWRIGKAYKSHKGHHSNNRGGHKTKGLRPVGIRRKEVRPV